MQFVVLFVVLLAAVTARVPVPLDLLFGVELES